MLEALGRFGKALEAYKTFQAKREAKVRQALAALVEDMTRQPGSAWGDHLIAKIVEKHLPAVMEASLPIADVSSDLLRSIADILGDKK